MTKARFNQWLLLATVAGAACTANATGCGGSSSSTVGGTDASADGSSSGASSSGASSSGASSSGSSSGTPGPDASDEDATPGDDASSTGDGASTSDGASGNDSGGGNGGVDAGSVCLAAANDTACTNPSTGSKDFCVSMACSACTDGTDDGACATAYGAGTLCVGGACVPGNCHTSTDCTTAGQICGVVTPNTCGACTNDLQCQGDATYGAGDMCNTTAGTCVSAACGTAGAGLANAACTANSGDECCAVSAVTACVPGNCCTSSQCTSGQSCVGNTCTTCSAASNNTYYVDPAAGTDNGHTGASTCPFKTITKALEFIGSNATSGTTIQLVDSDPVSNGETFPLLVPANVTIETEPSVAVATVTVAAGKVGFVLHAPSSGLSNLVLDGATNTANSGILVSGGSSATAGVATSVTNVTVKNFLDAGIVVGTVDKQATAGAVVLGPGLLVTGNGTSANPAPGLSLSSGTATITGTAATGAGHTSISKNTQHGVLVTGTASVNVTGSVAATAPGLAYVDFDNNAIAGLWISQTPSLTQQTNTISGLEITGISGGNGVHVEGGSYLKLTHSFIVGNHGSGIYISSSGTGATANSTIAGINLGTAAAPGDNTLQGPIGSLVNPVSGVCLAIPAVAAGPAQTLSAEGNIWGTVNCGSSGAVSHSATCANGSNVDIGGIGSGNKNTADVAMCTLE